MVGRQEQSRRATRRALIVAGCIAALSAGCGQPNPSPRLSEVRVYDAAGGPLEGADVVVHSPVGDVVETLLTDAQGVVHARVARDGGISVPVDGTATGVESVVGLPKGTPLRFGGIEPTIGVVDVTLAEFAGASAYYLDNGCSFVFVLDVSVPVTIQRTSACASTMDIVATALDADAQPLAYVLATDVPAADPLTLSAWQTDFDVVSLEGTAAPTGAVLFRGAPRVRREGLYYTVSGKADATIAAGGSASVDLLVPPGFGDVEVTAEVVFASGSVSSWTKMDSALGAAVSLDLGAELLVAPEELTVTLPEPGRAHVAWSGSAPEADATRIELTWSDAGIQGTWVLWQPAAGTNADYPALPASLSGRTPTGVAATFVGTRVHRVDWDFTGDYEAFLTERATSLTFPASYTIRTASSPP